MMRSSLMKFMIKLLLVLVFLFSIQLHHVQSDLSNAVEVELAEYVLNELRKLSDSGIYDTLQLEDVLSYEQTDGIFHTNTALKLKLSSPHWQESQKFEFIVMDHKDDNVRSFAIDEFPVMNSDAIEASWIQKVEKKKIIREEAFRRLEIEALLLGEYPSLVDETYLRLKQKLNKQSNSDILEMLDNSDLQSYRYNNSLIFQKQLKNQTILQEEKRLSSLSLKSLYEITILSTTTNHSDYEVYRAKELVDISIIYLQKTLNEI